MPSLLSWRYPALYLTLSRAGNFFGLQSAALTAFFRHLALAGLAPVGEGIPVAAYSAGHLRILVAAAAVMSVADYDGDGVTSGSLIAAPWFGGNQQSCFRKRVACFKQKATHGVPIATATGPMLKCYRGSSSNFFISQQNILDNLATAGINNSM